MSQVRVPEAVSLHTLAIRYEAPQRRAHGTHDDEVDNDDDDDDDDDDVNDATGEHDLVPGPDPPHELHLPRLPVAGEAAAAAAEAEGQHGEEDH